MKAVEGMEGKAASSRGSCVRRQSGRILGWNPSARETRLARRLFRHLQARHPGPLGSVDAARFGRFEPIRRGLHLFSPALGPWPELAGATLLARARNCGLYGSIADRLSGLAGHFPL